MTKEQIIEILEGAAFFKKGFMEGKRVFDNLHKKTCALLFFENSTRTKVSFEVAIKNLGGNSINVSFESSSILKGETLQDTIKTIDSMNVDALIVRNQMSGFSFYISKFLNAKVVNAGDGMNEHPTQAMLDAMTLIEKFGKIEGLKIAIIGDILHSRVARSDIYIFKKLGAKVNVCGPSTLIPTDIEKLGVKVYIDAKAAVKDCDAIIALRIQKERQKNDFFPSEGEFSRFFGVDLELLKEAKPNVVLMHPGPVNRNIEISSSVLESEFSMIDEQVTNGVFVRMSVLDYIFK